VGRTTQAFCLDYELSTFRQTTKTSALSGVTAIIYVVDILVRRHATPDTTESLPRSASLFLSYLKPIWLAPRGLLFPIYVKNILDAMNVSELLDI
jgi:hypothetical protein